MTTLVIPGKFDPGAATTVVFSDDKSGRVIAQQDAANVSASEVQTTVPVFFDPRTLKMTSGTVKYKVLQNGRSVTRSNQKVTVLPLLPVAANSTGTYLDTFLSLQETATKGAAVSLQLDGLASGSANTYQSTSQGLMAASAQFQSIRDQLAPLMAGKVAQVDIGTFQGVHVTMNPDALRLADNLIAALFLIPTEGKTTPPLPTSGTDLASSVSSLVQLNNNIFQAEDLDPSTTATSPRTQSRSPASWRR